MKNPTIGFISPFWLPMFGGAEQYHFRLATALRDRGMLVKVFCGIGALADRENGSLETTRFSPNINFATWWEAIRSPTDKKYEDLAHHYEFINSAITWAKKSEIEVALIGSPFNNPRYFHTRELYRRLSDLGIKVGLIHHDLSRQITEGLKKIYLSQAGDWADATKRVVNHLKHIFSKDGQIKASLMVGSPLCFQPDFVITNTHWSLQFIDPLNQCPKIVLHPLMERDYWRSSKMTRAPSFEVDITMVNPQSRKNPKLMAEFIASSTSERTFRVLKGGWGDAFKVFGEMIKDLPLETKKRVSFVEYVSDMRAVYNTTRMLLFPSFEEGYGMTPVEAMYCGTPVLSSNYPAIMEAVGNAAYVLCPFRDPKEKWIAASNEVLRDASFWKSRSLEWSDRLSKRQDSEVDELVAFLKNDGSHSNEV